MFGTIWYLLPFFIQLGPGWGVRGVCRENVAPAHIRDWSQMPRPCQMITSPPYYILTIITTNIWLASTATRNQMVHPHSKVHVTAPFLITCPLSSMSAGLVVFWIAQTILQTATNSKGQSIRNESSLTQSWRPELQHLKEFFLDPATVS